MSSLNGPSSAANTAELSYIIDRVLCLLYNLLFAYFALVSLETLSVEV